MLQRISLSMMCLFILAAKPVSADEAGPFISGSFQFVMIDGRFDEDGDSDCCSPLVDDSGYGFSLGGGYRLNRNFSIDATYWDLGDAVTKGFPGGGGRVGFDLSEFTIGGMATLPLSVLDIYARGGVAFWDADGRAIDGDGTDGYFGVGFAVNLGEAISIYSEYVYVDSDVIIDTIGAGIRYRF